MDNNDSYRLYSPCSFVVMVSLLLKELFIRFYFQAFASYVDFRGFSVAIFVSPHVCFILVLIFDCYVFKIMHL